MKKKLLCTACSIMLLSFNVKEESKIRNDFNVTVIGFFFGFDGSDGTTFPLTGARVDLMDSDADGSTLFDDVIKSAFVQSDGSFKVSGKGGDPGSFSWSKPDVYIRIVFNNEQGVRLTDELDWDRYENTPEHDHNNFEGTLDIGTWVTGTGVASGEGTKPGVWMKACNAWNDYISLMGAKPSSGKYDIEYWSAIWAGTPWTNTNTTHWPIHYTTRSSVHEFGHIIRHSFDGDATHFNNDVTRFRYARNHSPCDNNCNRIGTDTRQMGLAFGFNEGWAEFWENATRACTSTIDEECEGNIAHALLNISRIPGMNRKKMVEILKAHPGAIHSIDDFLSFVSGPVTRSTLFLVTEGDKKLPTINYKALDAQIQLAEVNKTLKAGALQLSQLKKQIETARSLAMRIKTCDSLGCYRTFQALIQPALLKAELEMKQLALQRIEANSAPATRESYLKLLGSGAWERKMQEQSSTGLKQVIQINTNAYQEALTAVRKPGIKAEEFVLLQKDLENKFKVFSGMVSKNEKLPLQANLLLQLDEEGPKLKKN